MVYSEIEIFKISNIGDNSLHQKSTSSIRNPRRYTPDINQLFI
jgi:hypothetical protein